VPEPGREAARARGAIEQLSIAFTEALQPLVGRARAATGGFGSLSQRPSLLDDTAAKQTS